MPGLREGGSSKVSALSLFCYKQPESIPTTQFHAWPKNNLAVCPQYPCLGLYPKCSLSLSFQSLYSGPPALMLACFLNLNMLFLSVMIPVIFVHTHQMCSWPSF